MPKTRDRTTTPVAGPTDLERVIREKLADADAEIALIRSLLGPLRADPHQPIALGPGLRPMPVSQAVLIRAWRLGHAVEDAVVGLRQLEHVALGRANERSADDTHAGDEA